ncbi:MAG: TonB-dependent receptor domain-containing protein [Acinetobacter faecalis]|uniref:TonB-dependent receptor n=1 Tax=Acinetobacter faecalis TaxID=2665161 RepID=A0AB35UUJ9_9GAMM|nr:TonB-dependent receptor [Acinetobacter faecalis]MDY6487604.1 TonB-dependent receptor [Acinetobacter faecalis]MDY6509549.1 TonB-dependent receptor [Acinetobacter faecalis]MDY6550256.1 TonB-dependent receptor [Acinetobacter faecalis]
MSKFKLNPLSIALLGAIATPTFAETTTENQNHQLSTIVVSAAGFEQDIKNAPASISVVTKEDIERKNATSVADLLVDIPGVDVRNGVGKTGGLNVSMRGMNADDTLILIDGRRQTTSTDVTPNGFAETSTSFMPPLSAIERIEVIRGPMSTLYGSDAMGGVINIITKKVSDEWNGNITVSGNVMENGAEADSWKTSFLLNGPLINDKLGLQLRGSYYDRGQSERIEGSTGRDPRPTTAHNYDVGGKLTFKVDNQNSLWFDSFHSSQNFKNEDNRLGTLDWTTESNIGSSGAPQYIPSASGYKDELVFNRSQFSLGHDGEYNFGNWKTYISHSETETKGRTIPTEAFPTSQQANNPIIGSDRELKNTDLILNSHVISQINTHKLTTGAEYKKQTIKDNIAKHKNGIDEFDQDSFSIYAEDEWSLLDNLTLTYGGRVEDHSGFGSHFSPRAYLVWNTNDILTIKGGVSTGYKAPSAKSLSDNLIGMGRQGRSLTFGNPNLKPETSTNYELGFNLEPNDKLNFNVTGFYNQIKDAIVSTNLPISSECATATTCSTSINASEAKVYGAEASVNYSVLPEWDIKAAYTYTKSKITDGESEGTYYNNQPRNAFNLTSTWHLSPAVDLWLQYEYKSERQRFLNTPNIDGVSVGQGSSDQEEYRLFGDKFSGYNHFNLGASYIVSDQLRLNVAVNNLLDKDFTDGAQSYDYVSNNASQTATGYKYLDVGSSTSGTYLAGRNYWLSVSYDF